MVKNKCKQCRLSIKFSFTHHYYFKLTIRTHFKGLLVSCWGDQTCDIRIADRYYLRPSQLVFDQSRSKGDIPEKWPRDIAEGWPSTSASAHYRAPDKVCIFISIMPISSPNPMSDHLLELSHRDDSNKRSNIGFGEEITKAVSIEVNFTKLNWVLVSAITQPYCQ